MYIYILSSTIETFCEKQILPAKTRQDVLLLVEEVLLVYTPLLSVAPLDVRLSYSEKKESLELIFENTGDGDNPLDNKLLPDELGLTIINKLAESVDYRRVNDLNRLTLTIKKI